MKATHVIAYILLIIGGLNWGILGIAYFFGSSLNVVQWIFGSWPWLLNVVYILVGIAAVMSFGCHKKNCKMCTGSSSASAGGQQM